jgi:serine/threonine protein kinase
MAKLYNEKDQQAEQSSEQERPKTIGSGFVTSVLGEGGAAIVYEIWNPKLEIHRAVKLWRPNVSEKDLQRFETEIKITSKLDHPNIVEIHTVGEWNGLPYIEMERIDGLSLQQILRTNGSLPPVVAVAIMIFICRALLYAHQEEFNLYGRKRKGVIHCDIKPANIMITRSGIVKLMDFGIANPTNVSLHTASDRVTGSLQYMAPEQIRSKEVDSRTDIYSVGVVLYEMLSGTKAFPSKQLLDVIEKRKSNDYVPLNQFCVNLPRRFYRVVSCCMQLQPEDRYQNVQELIKELTAVFKCLSHNDPQAVIQQFLDGGNVPVHKIQISRQILIPAVAAIVPTTLLIVTLITVFLKINKGDSDTPAVPVANKSEQSIQNVVIAPEPRSIPAVVAPVDTPPPTVVQKEPVAPPPVIENTQPEIVVAKKTRAVSSETERLNYLESLVEKGNLTGAIKQFALQTINDGAYYSLYARCFYESGEWEKAFEMADQSTKVPSKRVTPEFRKGQYILYKAKYYSSLFDGDRRPGNARSAITAWWEVREYFDGTAKATFAESEINRLSASIGENNDPIESQEANK